MRYSQEDEVEIVSGFVSFLRDMGVTILTDDDSGTLYFDLDTALEVIRYHQPDIPDDPEEIIEDPLAACMLVTSTEPPGEEAVTYISLDDLLGLVPYTSYTRDLAYELYNVWVHQILDASRQAFEAGTRTIQDIRDEMRDFDQQVGAASFWTYETERDVMLGTHDLYVFPTMRIIVYDKLEFEAASDAALCGLYPGSSSHFILRDEESQEELFAEYEYGPDADRLTWGEYVEQEANWRDWNETHQAQWLQWRIEAGYPMPAPLMERYHRVKHRLL